jgi:signal peptide peptidase SppA
MTYPRLMQRLYGVPLLITPDKAEVIETVFRAYVEGRSETLPAFVRRERPDVAALAGPVSRTQGGYLRTTDGVALIQIVGTLVQRSGGLDAESGLTSYERIAAKLGAAMDDPLTRAVLLEVDSPGGEGAGVFDLADTIRAARKRKPVYAVANEFAFSAAYALASAAEQVFAPRTGMVGSVGVIMLHVDQSAYDAKRGIVYTPIFAGKRKNDFSPHAPLSDAAATRAQDMVDRMYAVFTSTVASARNIDEQVVRDTEAGLLDINEATRLGMANGVATLDEVVAMLTDRIFNRTRISPAAGAATTPEGVSMSKDEGKAPAATAPANTVNADEAAQAQARSYEDGTAAGMKAERERQAKIRGSEHAKDRPKLAAHLADATDMSADAVIAILAESAKETQPANTLAARMPPNPNIGADVTTGADGDQAPRPLRSAQVIAMRDKQAGVVR